MTDIDNTKNTGKQYNSRTTRHKLKIVIPSP